MVTANQKSLWYKEIGNVLDFLDTQVPEKKWYPVTKESKKLTYVFSDMQSGALKKWSQEFVRIPGHGICPAK